MAEKERFDVYKDITRKIVMELAKGEIPWHKRWCSPIKGKMNYVSRRSYGGVNLLLLPKEGEYLTFKQCSDLGGTIRKGEHTTTVYQYYPYVRPQDKEEFERRKKEGLDTDELTIPVLKYLQVFHLSQVEGIETKITTVDHESAQSPVDMADFCLERLHDTTGIDYREEQTDAIHNDGCLVTLPSRTQFPHEEQWYATLFTEVAKNVFDRQMAQKSGEQRKENAVLDELTCEIASSMVMASVGLEIKQTQEDTLAECSRWAEALNKDFRMIVTAATRAQKVAERILQPII